MHETAVAEYERGEVPCLRWGKYDLMGVAHQHLRAARSVVGMQVVGEGSLLRVIADVLYVGAASVAAAVAAAAAWPRWCLTIAFSAIVCLYLKCRAGVVISNHLLGEDRYVLIHVLIRLNLFGSHRHQGYQHCIGIRCPKVYALLFRRPSL